MSPHRRLARIPLAALAVALPTAAWAHPEAGAGSGFVHGFMHPLGGLDHVLAMVAVGLFAATLVPRAFWAVPLAFVALMGIGGTLGMAGVPLPYVETAIGLSVVILGAVIVAHGRWSLAAAMALVGLFGVFHGHAHGAEMPQTLSGAAYAAGFLPATGALHLAGIALGLVPAWLDAANRRRAVQAGGAVIAALGAGLLIGAI